MNHLALAVGLYLGLADIPEPEPAMTDLARFPHAEVAAATYEFAREHVEWARAQQAMHPWEPSWCRWIEEAEHCRECWHQLWIAAIEDDGTYSRVEALRELKDLIGPDAYRAGHMPPPAPWWRFRRVP